MKRHLLSVLAVAAVASFAGAQERTSTPTTHGDSVSATARRANAAKRARRTTTTSRGEVARSVGYSVRAVARDYVGAENTSGDDLWRREQMMDRRCGKSRERCGKP
jgi:hypothetical protein